MLYYSVAAPSIKRGILFVKNMGNSQESLSFVPHFQIERAVSCSNWDDGEDFSVKRRQITFSRLNLQSREKETKGKKTVAQLEEKETGSNRNHMARRRAD